MTTISLSNLYKINAEDLIYFVAEHLLKQNKKSFIDIEDNGYALCAYRDSDGKSKCAVGSIISDEEYCEEMEGNSPSTVYDIFFKNFYREECSYEKWREKIAEIENLNIYSPEDNEIIDEHQSNLDSNMCILEKMRVIHDDQNTESWECEIVNFAYEFSKDLAKRIEAIEEQEIK